MWGMRRKRMAWWGRRTGGHRGGTRAGTRAGTRDRAPPVAPRAVGGGGRRWGARWPSQEGRRMAWGSLGTLVTGAFLGILVQRAASAVRATPGELARMVRPGTAGGPGTPALRVSLRARATPGAQSMQGSSGTAGRLEKRGVEGTVGREGFLLADGKDETFETRVVPGTTGTWPSRRSTGAQRRWSSG